MVDSAINWLFVGECFRDLALAEVTDHLRKDRWSRVRSITCQISAT
jgi:hypothetical protein